MATKLRRCLYIGLGGTGMNALLHTKKMFMETYGGTVPPMIGFLGIDTDEGAYKESLNSKYGPVTLDPYQQCSISCKDARAIYLQQRDSLTWIHDENIGAIDAMEIGAGQVRTNGRFAFTVNYGKISTALNQALYKIRDAKIVHDRDYELISNKTEIHMVFSICGGTGCGTFIDMAYLIQKNEPDCKLTGYAVLPDVFESMVPSGPAMAKVKPNAFGAISDLDWLMHLNAASQPLSMNYIKTTESVSKRPFNAIMFIDNTNENDDVYADVDQLTEMISLSLVIAAGALSVKTASVSDNIEKYYADGSMDVEDKKAWVAGLGACEIVFQGKDIAEIYSLKASQRLIHRMLNSCNDMDVVINYWIDKPEVNIRENNGFDNVIDFLLEKRPKITFTNVNAPLNAKPEIDQYITKALPKDKDLQERINILSQNVNRELKILLVKHINQECGVSDAEDIILGIQKQVNLFTNEMSEELETWEIKKTQFEQKIQIEVDNLSDLEKKVFVIGKSGKRENQIDALAGVTMVYVEAEREIIRRKGAITFYRGLQSTLLDEYTRLQNIKKLLSLVNSSLSDRLAEIYNQVGKSNQAFRIDLATEIARDVTVNDEQLSLLDFINSLSYEDKLYELSDKDTENAKQLFITFTSKLPESKKWSNTSIDEIINVLSEEEFQHVMKMAISKAMPLLQYNYQGYITNVDLYEGYYVGVPEEGHSRLEKNDNFKKMQRDSDMISFVQTGMKERIIIYRQLGIIPAYALSSLNTYHEKYDRCRTNCHIDANMLLRMQREDFSLQPKHKEDDTLELWVHGIIFGLIKFENDSYYYKSQLLGDPLFGYWVKMNIQYRDEAFEHFKRHKSQIRKEYNDYINEIGQTKGMAVMTEFKANVKDNYLEKYAQINMTVEDLSKRGNEKIADLMRREIVFVQKNL